MSEAELYSILHEYLALAPPNKLNEPAREAYKKLIKYIDYLQKENQELKADYGTKAQVERDLLMEENQELKKQQKEFIEWLENEINICDGFLDTIKSDLEEISYAGRIAGKTYIATQIMKNETAKKCYEEALSKYKETIDEIREHCCNKYGYE